jgi:putative membrane protein
MVSYDPKKWGSFIFLLHKADTFRKLLWLLIAFCAYSGLIAWLEVSVFHLIETTHLRNISVLPSLLGFIISLLLVFRTNTAYDRWWEGRKLWGSLVNNSRNLAIKLSAILVEDKESCRFFRNTIPAYAAALKNHLRNSTTGIELFDNDPVLSDQIDRQKHIPNQVALLMLRRIMELHRTGQISGDQLIVINAELQSFTDICGACERIKNTPIPFSYAVFIKKFIVLYVLTLPLAFVFSMGYLVVPVTAFIFYVLASLEIIAEEIEDPFGIDPNDLPLDKIAHNIQVHIHELL